MESLLKNYFGNNSVKVHEPRIFEKVYNSFSRASTIQSDKHNFQVFSRGKINRKLDKITFT